MKKYAPFVLPFITLVVLFVLVFRWYQNNAKPTLPTINGEGVSIENLSASQAATLRGVGDFKTVTLEKSEGATASGVIRYDVTDEGVEFSVIVEDTSMSEESEALYKVWVKSPQDGAAKEAFVLEMAKGGFVGSALLPKDVLPIEILVGLTTPEEAILKGTIPAAQAE